LTVQVNKGVYEQEINKSDLKKGIVEFIVLCFYLTSDIKKHKNNFNFLNIKTGANKG
jgi:hypothetical protein